MCTEVKRLKSNHRKLKCKLKSDMIIIQVDMQNVCKYNYHDTIFKRVPTLYPYADFQIAS